MEWLGSNWPLLAALAAALVAVAKIAVKFTASPKDDEVVEKVAEVVEPLLPGKQSDKE